MPLGLKLYTTQQRSFPFGLKPNVGFQGFVEPMLHNLEREGTLVFNAESSGMIC